MAIRIVNKSGVADTQAELLLTVGELENTYVYCTDTGNTYVWSGGIWALFNNEFFYTQNPPPEDTSKQDLLVSGDNIKTINGNSLLGSGDIVISGTGDLVSTNNLSDVANAATARNNILPSKTGNTLKVLRVNAGETDYELATISGGGLEQYQVRRMTRR